MFKCMAQFFNELFNQWVYEYTMADNVDQVMY